MKNSVRLSNNLAGAFLVALVFLVITVALDRDYPKPETRYVFTLFCAFGLASLVGWTWLSVKAITPRD